jgi:hypothetical protein
MRHTLALRPRQSLVYRCFPVYVIKQADRRVCLPPSLREYRRSQLFHPIRPGQLKSQSCWFGIAVGTETGRMSTDSAARAHLFRLAAADAGLGLAVTSAQAWGVKRCGACTFAGRRLRRTIRNACVGRGICEPKLVGSDCSIICERRTKQRP